MNLTRWTISATWLMQEQNPNTYTSRTIHTLSLLEWIGKLYISGDVYKLQDLLSDEFDSNIAESNISPHIVEPKDSLFFGNHAKDEMSALYHTFISIC